MAISDVNGIVAGLGAADRFIIDKASIANQTTGGFSSLWRATGQPGQGAIPTSAAICTKALTGAIGFNNQTAPVSTYHAWQTIAAANAGTTIELHDRVAHMGGLSLTSTTSQTVGLDLSATGLNPAADRIGASDFSDIMWWLEIYSDGGATASNATINVTYNDDSSGNLPTVAVGGTLRASRLIILNGLIPAASSGKFIKDINTVINSASTGTAGNFGFTATRNRSVWPTHVANKMELYDWAALGFPEIPNDACLMLITNNQTTSSGIVRGNGKLAHG